MKPGQNYIPFRVHRDLIKYLKSEHKITFSPNTPAYVKIKYEQNGVYVEIFCSDKKTILRVDRHLWDRAFIKKDKVAELIEKDPALSILRKLKCNTNGVK